MARVLRTALASCLALLALTGAPHAQSARLNLDVLYHPERRLNFSGAAVPDVTWADATSWIAPRRTSDGVEWQRVDAVTGNATALFDPARMETALRALPNLTPQQAAALARAGDLTLNPASTGVLFTFREDLYFYDLSANAATRLTTAEGAEEEASFSPDGRSVAFVRANNLFVVDISTRRERALTSDGSAEILNGKLDWLYQEEIYGRGRFRGYWWSPDSTRLAFLRLDERPVPEYTVVDHIPYRPALEVTDYPKAGDPNPIVQLGVAALDGTGPTWVRFDSYAGTDILIVNVDWTPDSRAVVNQVQNRQQTWLDLNLAEAGTGTLRRLLRETTPAWVNENGNPVWLKDGSFLWVSERSGFRHVYHYGADGTERRPVTAGRWDVRTFYGVDEAASAIYFASGEHDHLDTDIYRIGLDGQGLTRLSRTSGTHRAMFDPTFARYVDVWSDVNTPPQSRLHRADGTEIRVIDANPVRTPAEYGFVRPEFVQVTARDGAVMDAMLFKPADFDPSRRYPVYQFTYAGPGAANVRNRWNGGDNLFHQFLAQQGVVVWVHDNRSAGGRGVESQWPVWGRVGELELQDLEDGLDWLTRQPYVDPSRILLHGWSYGGFMTAYALTHSTRWAAGIVGAPVTDWRDYDTIYTEKLMKLPQENADGYRRTAPRYAADRLQGRLLLVHGTMDDNVHLQNSMQFAYELQKAGKAFEMMTYPRQRHGFDDMRLVYHLRSMMFDFVMRTLRPDDHSRAASTAAAPGN